MPSISVKSAAELLRLPAYSQVRILTEQKYPKKGSQVFRTPYYSVAINGIRSYFDSGNSKASLVAARNKIQSLSQESKRNHNLRVLNAFENSKFSNRKLSVAKSPRLVASIGTVDFRLSPDLRLVDSEEPLVIYINCRTHPIDEEIARYTLELSQWVLEQNDDPLPLKRFVYLDLAKNTEFGFTNRRKKTMSALEQNTMVIDALWPTL